MNFCTYFDSNYLNKGLVCYNTLHGFLKETLKFYIICLDELVFDTMSKLDCVVAIKITDIESYYPKLSSIKNTRLPKEYFATMSPILPLYVFDKFNCEKLFYTDADMAFWSNPTEIINVLGNKSILVTDHGFEPPRSGIRFNVGILGYRNDNNCREFLNWWADRCIEWCYWTTTDDGKCGDQGYLNILHDDPERFKNHLSCPHPGINMGPWNIAMHELSEKNGIPIVDGVYNLICYHYHEFKLVANSYYPTNWKITNTDRTIVYEPYFNLIKNILGTVKND